MTTFLKHNVSVCDEGGGLRADYLFLDAVPVGIRKLAHQHFKKSKLKNNAAQANDQDQKNLDILL